MVGKVTRKMSSQTRQSQPATQTVAQTRHPLARVTRRGSALRPGVFLITTLTVTVGTGMLAVALSQQPGSDFYEPDQLISIIVTAVVAAFVVFAALRLPALTDRNEYARLRSNGASRRQILSVAVARALLPGLLGGALGGLGGALVFQWAPQTRSASLLAPSAIILAFCLALAGIVGIAAALPPVIEAFRSSPVQTLRQAEAAPVGSVVPRAVIGIAVGTVGLGIIHLGVVHIVDGNGAALGLGAGITIAGMLIVFPAASAMTAAVLGPVLRLMAPVAAPVALRNLQRAPGRFLTAADALFVVMTSVVGAIVLAASTPQPSFEVTFILPSAAAVALLIPALANLLRVREYGLLRAPGAQRHSIAAVALIEFFITLLYALVLGTAVGAGLAAALATYLGDSALLDLTIPYESLGWVLLGSFVLGLLGAATGALAASRSGVLRAITGG